MTAFDINTLTLEADQPEFEMVPAGVYEAVISKIEPFDGTNYKSGEPEQKLKFIFTVASGDWANEVLDALINHQSNIADSRNGLNKIWKAVTGETIVVGGKYQIGKLLNQRLQIIVEHKGTPEKGMWPRVTGYSPAPVAGRRRAAAPVAPQPMDADDGDDLTGA